MKKKVTIREIESHLKKKCTEKDWPCQKFSGPKKKGIPDCVITAPGGTVLYVEVKVPGKKSSPLQRNDSLVASHGIHVFVVTSKENIDVLLNTFQAAIDAGSGLKK
jgi:VRR-NUC domain